MERKNGDWTIRATKKIFGNEYFEVFEDDVVQPDGAASKYATIRLVRGAAVLPVGDDLTVYLTRQFRYALGRANVEVVSGAIEDEEPLAAARREIKEELGIEAAEWTDLGAIESDTSLSNSRAHLFLARGLRFGEPEREGTEQIEPLEMPLAEAVARVMSGEITHGQTIALVLKAHELLAGARGAES